MGSITKQPNGRWRARWRELDGSGRSKTFARKVQAEQHLARVAMHQYVEVMTPQGRRGGMPSLAEHAEKEY
jgi:hypothetical protein